MQLRSMPLRSMPLRTMPHWDCTALGLYRTGTVPHWDWYPDHGLVPGSWTCTRIMDLYLYPYHGPVPVPVPVSWTCTRVMDLYPCHGPSLLDSWT